VDKYDAIKHGHTANPGAQEQKAAAERREKIGKRGGECVRRIHVLSNILQDEMLEPSNACERASRDRKRKETQVHGQLRLEQVRRTANTCSGGRQFPPIVRDRLFRELRFTTEDCSALAVVGDAVSPPPPLRFSVAFVVEGVDDPAEAEAVGLGALVCCGVPFPLSGDDPGEDVDGAFCGMVAGGI